MSLNTPRAVLRASALACAPISRSSGLQGRWFSATATQSGKVLSFPETSSPELDKVLATIRMKILLPSYLPQQQRKKLTRPRYIKKLANNPITMEVEGEELRFYPKEPNKGDFPNTRKILFEAIAQMETKDDWEQLPRLLEGLYYYANRKLLPEDYPKMIRKAGMKGQIGVILNCARRASRTGFKLDSSEKVSGVMYFLVRKALDSNWDAAETEKTLRWAESVVDLLESEDHRPKKVKGEVRTGPPLHRDPQVLATPLHLAATLAVKHRGAQDVDGKVYRYARDFVELWPAGAGLRDLRPMDPENKRDAMRYLSIADGYLLSAPIILKALDLAIEVVGPELTEPLATRRQVLAEELEGVLTERPDGVGAQFYNRLYGSAQASQEHSEESSAASEAS